MIMNSDGVLFYEVCQLFEALNRITKTASNKRANINGDTGSSLYLTKVSKKQIHKLISEWFLNIQPGALLSVFRLLVPEVKMILNFDIHRVLKFYRRTLKESII